MRIALVLVALVGCKAKQEKAISEPVSVEEARAQIGSASAGSGSAASRASVFPGLPQCDVYQQVVKAMMVCNKLPTEAKDALERGFDAMRSTWTGLSEDMRVWTNDLCKQSADAIREVLSGTQCTYNVEAVIDEGVIARVPKGSRNVPSEKGVPLDRAVLGSLPHPFGALQVIKPTMLRDEILTVLPEARRDGDNITVPLGVETLTAKISIDSTGHISDIEIPMDPFPSDLFEQAWGESPRHVWLDRAAMWRADNGGDDGALHIFPFKRFVDVIGVGRDLLAETTPIIGNSITTLKEKLGGRIDDWTEEDEMGNERTRPRVLLPSTEMCHYDSMYVLEVFYDTVVGATFTQCYDSEDDRRAAMAAMEKTWGRAMPARTKDDRLVFKFSRAGRTIEMTEDPTVDPEGAWVVKITKP